MSEQELADACTQHNKNATAYHERNRQVLQENAQEHRKQKKIEEADADEDANVEWEALELVRFKM
ncbi:hypothetical protein DXG01_016687 [Tephrocybe rancida]|nr:hypothetical protein DXG01_016687 [Tephrocybe rancida]